tara:strand:- start:1456 stop:1995 length:540 start_codon:yes stop_codon:yes gene_type:complete
MQKATQEEYDAFKLRVINAVMKNYKTAECRHYEMTPLVYLKAFNYNHKIAPIPPELFENQVCKELAAKTICDMVKVSESPMMCFVTEGYMAKVHQDKVNLKNLPRPSQLPEDERNEVVFFCFEAKDLEEYSLAFIKEVESIDEDPGFKIKLIPDSINKQIDNGRKMGGTFSNFYSKIQS